MLDIYMDKKACYQRGSVPVLKVSSLAHANVGWPLPSSKKSLKAAKTFRLDVVNYVLVIKS
jgi:hypothetical protein